MEELRGITGIEKAVAEIRTALFEEHAAVKAEMVPYINGVVTADTLAAWKKDRASINKRMKENESKRTGIAREWTEHLAPITGELKAITNTYKAALENIDTQTRCFEEERKRLRREEIKAIWEEAEKPAEIADWLELSDVYDTKWENASCNDKTVREAIKTAYDQLMMSYITIKGMAHEYEEEGLEELRKTRSFGNAVTRMNSLQQQARIIEEKRKAREEAERKAEEERKAREEARAREEAERRTIEAEEIKTISDGSRNIDFETGEILDDDLLPDDELLPMDDDLPMDEPKERIRVDLEIYEEDMMKLVQILDESGIFYNIY